MSKDLFWLTLTILMTALFWLPYILHSIFARGLILTMRAPQTGDPVMSEWANRAKRAHANAVENLVIFAPLVLIAHDMEQNLGLVTCVCSIYFWARLVHYVSYVIYPFPLRTLSFFVGVGAQLTLGGILLGFIH